MPAPEIPYIPFYVRVLDRLKGIGIILAVILLLAYGLYFYYFPKETAIYTGAVIGVLILTWIFIGQVANILSGRNREEISLTPPPYAEIQQEMKVIDGVGGIISVHKFELGRRLILHYIRYNPLNKKNPADISQLVKRSNQVLNDAEFGLIIDQLVSEEELITDSSGTVSAVQPGKVLNEDFINNLFQYLVVLSETKFRSVPDEQQFQTIVQFITDRFKNRPVSDWTEIHSGILDEIAEYMSKRQTESKMPRREDKFIDSLV